jgi:hypothetical protein
MANLTRMMRDESRRTRRHVAALTLCLLGGLSPRLACAQGNIALEQGGALLAGGDEMAYLRMRALTDTSLVPLTVQPLSSASSARLRQWASSTNGPWQTRFAAPAAGALSATRRVGAVQWWVLRPEGGLTYHSALPLSRNDGVVWQGRGVTTSLQGGIGMRWRGLEVQLAPIAFEAQNAEFALAPNGRTGEFVYADPRFSGEIDHVQAFGQSSYGRLDAGESFVRLDAFGATVGLSNARMTWGPAREYPLVMSTNAGGFAHFFAGTAEPVNVWIGTVQARLIGGRIEQSDYSPVDSGRTHRFTSGFVASFSPRGLRGLEIGGTRVMQVRWPEGGPSLAQILRPFQTIISDPLEGNAPNQNAENGFASAFIRVAPPGSGLEAYAELSREDFTGNLRALIAKPDDLAQFTIGVARSVMRSDGGMRVFRLELVNGELSAAERGQRGIRVPIPSYTHGLTRQGLTARGQILGSPVAYGGSGGVITWERYSEAGRSTLQLERQLRLDWLPALGGTGGTEHAETLYGIRYERTRFLGGREVTATIAPSRVLNRNLVVGNDLWNLELGLRWRGW